MVSTGSMPSLEARAKSVYPTAQDTLKVQCRHLGGECLDRLEVEVVIQVKIVKIFTVNEKVEHVVALAANL